MRERDGPTGHVFISYVRENKRDVDLLQKILESAGVWVWRDTADLWPGEDWRVKIREAITADALVFIACFSHESIVREKSYQNEELTLAIEQLRMRRPDEPWLIPVRFDDCDIPERDIGGGRPLSSIQRADLFGENYPQGAARLVATVLRIFERRSVRPEPFIATMSWSGFELRLVEAEESGARTTRTSTPRVEIQSASARLARQLHMEEGAQVVSRHTQCWIDDETPWYLQTSFYPMQLVMIGATRLIQAEEVAEGTVTYLEESLGIREVGRRDEIEARMPDMNEAAFFGLPRGGPVQVLELSRTSFDQSGRPIRFTVTILPAYRNRVTYEDGILLGAPLIWMTKLN